MEQKRNRNGTEIQWKLRTDNESSVLGACPIHAIIYKLGALNRASIVCPQFPLNFYSISVQYEWNGNGTGSKKADDLTHCPCLRKASTN